MEFFKQSIGLENCIVRLCTIQQIKLHGYFIKSGLCNPIYKSSSIFFEFSNHPKVSYIILDWSLLFMTPFAAHCGKGLIGWKSMSMIMSLLTTWKPVLVLHQDPCLTHFHWNDKLYTISIIFYIILLLARKNVGYNEKQYCSVHQEIQTIADKQQALSSVALKETEDKFSSKFISRAQWLQIQFWRVVSRLSLPKVSPFIHLYANEPYLCRRYWQLKWYKLNKAKGDVRS